MTMSLKKGDEPAVWTGRRKRCGKGGWGFPQRWPQSQWPWAECGQMGPNNGPAEVGPLIVIMLAKTQGSWTVTPKQPLPTAPRGATSHGTLVLGWRVLTGLQPAHDSFRQFRFPSRHRFYLKSWLRNILDPRARPCGQRSQAAEMKFLLATQMLHQRQTVWTGAHPPLTPPPKKKKKRIKKATRNTPKLTTPRGERLMATRAVRTETRGMLIYVTLDPFTASSLLCLSVLIPHSP